ncbi:hypothetical protein CMUS01_02752 [Colletotrichum musicola]|uniref:Uncharacterized protein n=1 Tax=Colletotrichum musicola TaxID=2175873 RepID=A0A8H6U6R9_9PEZI|nr:hypothetical protein CMUS01_02752 [Colletotrichum musicola]
MSQPTSATLPPEYAADAGAVVEALPPDTLRLAGRFIHSASSTGANSAGLYEINHQIDFLRETDRKVEFSRIDYVLKRQAPGSAAAAAGSAPQIVSRAKRVFDLERPPAVVQEPFAYYLRPASQSALGTVGVKFAKIGGSACKAWRVRRKVDGTHEPRGVLFDVRPNNDVLDWLDGDGTRLAVEETRDDMHSLTVLVPLERARRDALVAVWCVRRWEEKATEFHRKRSWKDVKYIMQTCTSGLPGNGGTINTKSY